MLSNLFNKKIYLLLIKLCTLILWTANIALFTNENYVNPPLSAWKTRCM